MLKFPSINTYHLVVFYFVANHKNISTAAEELCLTQPTVTKHIKNLEDNLGMKLIEVKRKRVVLTSAGEGLYLYAREIYAQAIAAERYIEHMKYSNVNIGVSPLFVSAISKAINTLTNKLHSSVRINIKFGSHMDLIEDVIDLKLDLAIVPDLGYGQDKVSNARIADGVKLVFFASPDHVIFKKAKIQWKDLCNYPLLVGHEPFATKKVIPDKMIAEGVHTPLNMDLTANNIECCKILVKNGKNISVCLKEDLERELNDGTLRIIPLPNPVTVEVDAVAHRGLLTSPIIQNIISYMKASF
jgi:DNA-binding transcriptional LysR family regulator